MRWLPWVTLSFVVLTLVACGDAEEVTTSAGGPAADEVPELPPLRPDPDAGWGAEDWRAGTGDGDTRDPDGDDPDGDDPDGDDPDGGDPDGEDAEAKPSSTWPGIDDDPSMASAAKGAGDWCGTDMRGRGAVLGRAWTGPDPDGIWRRRGIARDIVVDVTARIKLHELRVKRRASKDRAERAKLDVKIADFEKDLRARESRGIEYGLDVDGVFYMSKEGETLEAFRARVKTLVAESAEKARKAKGGK